MLLKFPAPARQFIANTLAAEGIISEYEVRTKKNETNEIWILFSAKIIPGDHDAHAVIVDITKRKQFEAMVQEQAALLNETQDAIIVLDENEQITFWNRGAELTYGWGANEVTGAPFKSFCMPATKNRIFGSS